MRGEDGRYGSGTGRACARVLVVVAGLVAQLVGVPAAHAAELNVTPGAVDAVTNGNCSIREAITAANTDSVVDACQAGSGADTINAAGSFVLTTPDNAANGLPVITSTITINGAQISRASSAPAFRIFFVATSGNLTLFGATVSGGLAVADCPGIASTEDDICGGGIANNGTLTVNSSRIIDNVAAGSTDTSGFVEGGGIDNDGMATVTSSVVSGNTTTNTGVGRVAAAGLAMDDGTSTVRSSQVNGNTASCSACRNVAGAGITNFRGRLTVERSQVNDNTASCACGEAFGGGIANSRSATATVTSSTINGNTASCTASDCFGTSGGIDNSETLNLTSSQVRNNTARAPSGFAQGGGLFNFRGTATLTRSAVTGNNATGASAEGGGIFKNAGAVVLNGALVSGNTPNNCTPPIGTCA